MTPMKSILDGAVDTWLQEQVGPACDALKADPSRAVSSADVRAMLRAEYEAAAARK
jgi:antitoxin ParD1/3/4